MTRLRLGPITLATALVLLAALAAHAYIPQASRVVRAVADRNEDAGRAQPLRLELVLRVEESDPIGSGELVSHPNGLARLELRSTGGVVERHVLQGGEHLAMRDGERLLEPREFLPPLFLLQTDREVDLRSGLSQLGADLDSIGLAPCGESDCYVIGDPSRVPPPFDPIDEMDAAPEPVAPTPPPISAPQPRFGDAQPADDPHATLWVDRVSFEPRRIDLRNGVRVWLGPPAIFGKVQVPAWFRIDEPGKRPATFDVLSVSAVEAPAAAFSRSWLERPIVRESPLAETGPRPSSRENP